MFALAGPGTPFPKRADCSSSSSNSSLCACLGVSSPRLSTGKVGWLHLISWCAAWIVHTSRFANSPGHMTCARRASRLQIPKSRSPSRHDPFWSVARLGAADCYLLCLSSLPHRGTRPGHPAAFEKVDARSNHQQQRAPAYSLRDRQSPFGSPPRRGDRSKPRGSPLCFPWTRCRVVVVVYCVPPKGNATTKDICGLRTGRGRACGEPKSRV